jgi:hypothetical protein
MTRKDSGRIGGLATLKRYGKDQLRDWGKLGGRPRSLTYDEIRQQQRLEQNNNKGGDGPPGNNLNQLKALLKQRQSRSSGVLVTSIEEAGIGQETPQGQPLPERTEV